MIELKNIHLTVALGTAVERSILNGVDLRVNVGDFITVVGTNGAGKSTLFDVIAGEKISSKGSIHIDNLDVTQLPAHQRSHSVARVFQDPLLGSCGELTVMENMLLARQRGQKRKLKSAETDELRAFFIRILADFNLGLEKRLDVLMKQLSGGQRQAVSLLMTTLSPMQVLLLDEHTSALDPRTGKQIMDLTAQIVATHKLTALMITHNLHNALKFGNRTVLLHEGRILRDWSGKARAALTPNELLEILEETIN